MFSWSLKGLTQNRGLDDVLIFLFYQLHALKPPKGILKERRAEGLGCESHVCSLSWLGTKFCPTEAEAALGGQEHTYSAPLTFVYVVSFLHRMKENTRRHLPALTFVL